MLTAIDSAAHACNGYSLAVVSATNSRFQSHTNALSRIHACIVCECNLLMKSGKGSLQLRERERETEGIKSVCLGMTMHVCVMSGGVGVHKQTHAEQHKKGEKQGKAIERRCRRQQTDCMHTVDMHGNRVDS